MVVVLLHRNDNVYFLVHDREYPRGRSKVDMKWNEGIPGWNT